MRSEWLQPVPHGDAAEPNEIYAVKFAHFEGIRADFYHGSGAHPLHDRVALDYFVWVIRTPGGDLVLDAGFTPEVAARRKKPDYFRSPAEALELFGVRGPEVRLVILSHLHFDHVGDLSPFTNAKFVLQDEELRFWTGRYAHRREFSRLVEADDIMALVHHSLAGRVEFVDGDREVAPGVSVHHLGGHTPGMQVVRVATASGPIVLACDAAHLGDNVCEDMPTSAFTDLPALYRGFDRMIELAGGDVERVIPGHEPTLLDGLPPVPGLEGIVGRVA